MQYANNYLKPYYQNESVARDDKLSIAPCSEFINLALVDKGRNIHKDDTFSQASLHDGVDKIRGEETPLELDDIVLSGKRLCWWKDSLALVRALWPGSYAGSGTPRLH